MKRLFAFGLLVCTVLLSSCLAAEENPSATEDIEGGFFYTVDPEYLESVYGTPQEVLRSSTKELLDYFLNSQIMREQTFSVSSSIADNDRELDLSWNEAYCELLSRKDFNDALYDYMSEVINADLQYGDPERRTAEVFCGLREVLAVISASPELTELHEAICEMSEP